MGARHRAGSIGDDPDPSPAPAGPAPATATDAAAAAAATGGAVTRGAVERCAGWLIPAISVDVDVVLLRIPYVACAHLLLMTALKVRPT